MSNASGLEYGKQDSSYKAAGEYEGIRRLVNGFYDLMDQLAETKAIRYMHPDDLTVSRDKLVCFLSGWLGGPRLYAEKYGSLSIPAVHQHLAIGEAERDSWLFCMKHAVDQQPYEPEFKAYLMDQFFIPAERIRQTSSTES